MAIATFKQQLTELGEVAELVHEMRGDAKTSGGRLTPFGKDLLHTLHKHGMQSAKIAKLLDITPAAVTQNAAQLGENGLPKTKSKPKR